MTITEFRLAVFTFCVLLNASETSGFRTRLHNVLVKGVEYSPHTFGLGQDVTYDTTPTLEDRREVATRLGLKLIEGTEYDHLQPLDWRAG